MLNPSAFKSSTGVFRELDDAEAELAGLVDADVGAWEFPPQDGRGRPTKLFTLNTSMGSDTDENGDTWPRPAIVSASEGSNSADDTANDASEWGEL